MSNPIRYFEEDMATSQGKLVIGLRTGVDYMDYDRYYSLMLANSILGGGPHSKLFNNVREKESICYYANSGLEKCKGLMMVNSGIDPDQYDRALKLIRKELEDVKLGNFTDLEIEKAKRSISCCGKSHCDCQFLYATNICQVGICKLLQQVRRLSSCRKITEGVSGGI